MHTHETSFFINGVREDSPKSVYSFRDLIQVSKGTRRELESSIYYLRRTRTSLVKKKKV